MPLFVYPTPAKMGGGSNGLAGPTDETNELGHRGYMDTTFVEWFSVW